jgi:hypothetical protein
MPVFSFIPQWQTDASISGEGPFKMTLSNLKPTVLLSNPGERIQHSVKLKCYYNENASTTVYNHKEEYQEDRQINPYIQMAVDEIAGKIKDAPQLKMISLLVEVHSGKQASYDI